MRIGCISDVCLGYGSPQIASLTESLADYYGAESLVIEPHRPELPPRFLSFPSLRIQRTPNRFDPYTEAGRVEYILEAARLLNDYSPDLLIVCCTYCLPALFKLRRRPDFVIYYCYESIPYYGNFDMEMNRHLDGMVDLIVFPEENRAAREVARFGFKSIRKVVLYNCPDQADAQENLPGGRNGRVIYGGSIGPQTLAEYYTRPEIQKFPIDLYGPVAFPNRDRETFFRELGGRVRYLGQLDAGSLKAVRRQYAYSIIMWNPSVENQLYAAPNKFFESIADRVPVIAAPHPQCEMLIRRYRCGLLTPDWSPEGLEATLETAFRAYPGDVWEEMAANCTRAVRRELNWRRQFEKLKPYLGSGTD